jgi:ABC-2 type transport system ATP-binding protein
LATEHSIEVERLTKRFSDVTAVDNLSFTVAPGEIVGLLGSNGAGKTTTIQLLLGLTIPTSGVARVLGLDVQQHRRTVLQRVNFSSAYISLPTNLSVWENLNVFARLYGVRQPRRKILELLELFEMPDILHRITGALSSGQLTRLNLCKAFLNDPEVLFLDEPTASLDPAIATKVRETLQHIQHERQVTILYTSHNMHEIERLCDRIIFLAQGRIVTQGTPQAVLMRAQIASLEELFISIAQNGTLRNLAEATEDI